MDCENARSQRLSTKQNSTVSFMRGQRRVFKLKFVYSFFSGLAHCYHWGKRCSCVFTKIIINIQYKNNKLYVLSVRKIDGKEKKNVHHS